MSKCPTWCDYAKMSAHAAAGGNVSGLMYTICNAHGGAAPAERVRDAAPALLLACQETLEALEELTLPEPYAHQFDAWKRTLLAAITQAEGSQP